MGNWFHDLGRVAAGLLGPHGAPAPAQAASYAPGDYSIHFFLQLAVILLACRLVGRLARALGQPQVVGEMVAGVLLGPSLLGLVAPAISAALFPPASRAVLYAGAQLGVGLYMFLVGTTFDLSHFRARARSAATVSLAGIAAPFAVAAAIAPTLLGRPGLFAATLGPGGATLFLGACIALTAFPMLARIITERGLAGTPLGTLALTAGACDDACSWGVLAIVLATFGGGPGVAILAIGGGVVWLLAVVLAGPRVLAPLAARVERDGAMGPATFAWVLIAFCVSAFLMDAIGIHAIFGGFLIGAAMPRGRLTAEIRRQLEPVATVLLLPLFFTYSGLNTRLDVLAQPSLLLLALGITAASILAKGGACWLAARLAGEDGRTALGVGALMNARGLMELIIVNIGLQKGIIGPVLFSMLVLMAVVTTLMASPLLALVFRGTGGTGALSAARARA